MKITVEKKQINVGINSALFFLLCLLLGMTSRAVIAGSYLSSTHGDDTDGVSRLSGYSPGNCAHCHEQHAMVGGTEPDPTGGAQGFLLFDVSNSSQTVNFCFNCHGEGVAGYQDGVFVTNRSYSHRAGGWLADTLSNVEAAFSLGSSHNLADVITYASGQSWNFTSNSNGCAVCHDPHVVQGDPVNNPDVAKTSITRGTLTTLPSAHPTTDPWGDNASEKTSNLYGPYQAPYRFGSTTTYEPDGSSTTDGSNLADYNTFCLDCHQYEVTSTNTTSMNPGTTAGKLTAINWDTGGDKHGKVNADGIIVMKGPYTSTVGKVLACTDCHEPHGSANDFLLRGAVNGSVLGGTVSTGADDYSFLCDQCHDDDGGTGNWFNTHHDTGGGGSNDPYKDQSCASCHPGGSNPITCSNCHFHGSFVDDPANTLDKIPFVAPTTRTTF